jgi:hypothetical protein
LSKNIKYQTGGNNLDEDESDFEKDLSNVIESRDTEKWNSLIKKYIDIPREIKEENNFKYIPESLTRNTMDKLAKCVSQIYTLDTMKEFINATIFGGINAFHISPKDDNHSNKLFVYFQFYTGNIWGINGIQSFPGHIIFFKDDLNSWYQTPGIEYYREYLNKFLQVNNSRINEITFYGLSMGGTGALLISQYYPDISVCIAINPQAGCFKSDSGRVHFHSSLDDNIIDSVDIGKKHIEMLGCETDKLFDDMKLCMQNSKCRTYILNGATEFYTLVNMEAYRNIKLYGREYTMYGDLISSGIIIGNSGPNVSIILLDIHLHGVGVIDLSEQSESEEGVEGKTLGYILINNHSELKKQSGTELLKTMRLKFKQTYKDLH